MPQLFTYKKISGANISLLAKLFLAVALLVFFLPLLILPFYNHPFADDYFCGYNLNNKGFIAYQIFIYKNWGGRFAATFIGSLFAYHGFLYQHYYLHSLMLLALNSCSAFFLITIFCKKVLGIEYKLSTRIVFTFLVVALEICSLPQPQTYFFWFSSAITYQLPVILVQFEITLFVLLFYTNSWRKNLYTVLLPLLVFIIAGFSELFIITQLFLFIIIAWLKLNRKFPVVFILCVIALIISSMLVLLAPGNQIRAHEIVSKNFFTGAAAGIYHCVEVVWYILKNPLFWFIVISIIIYGDKINRNAQLNLFIQQFQKNKLRFACFIIAFLIVTIASPVVALKGGIIPERYVNAVVCCMLILLLLYVLIYVVSIRSAFISFNFRIQKSIVYFLLAIGLLCNDYIIDAYKSLLIAPAYNLILSEREVVLKQASEGDKIATIKTYDAALNNLIQTKYNASSVTFQQLIQQKPPLLFFEDDLATFNSIEVIKHYYGLDSIIVKDK